MTETLDRINTVLAGWEAQPDTTDVDGWLPGDPIYDRPMGSHFGEQHIRPMFQLLEEHAMPARCTECDTYWRGPSACFVCGQKVLGLPGHERPPVTYAQAGSFSEQMRQVAEAFGHDFDRAIASQLSILLEPPANPAAPTVDELNAAIPVGGVLYASLHTNSPTTVEGPEGWAELEAAGRYARQVTTWAPSAGSVMTFYPATIETRRDPEPTPRDRWDKVHARALRHLATNELELRIEAGINDRRYASRIVLEEDELARDPGLYGRTLDEMVDRIERMAGQQAGPPRPTRTTHAGRRPA